MTRRTHLFAVKVAQNDKHKFNGHDHGDAWKRSIYGNFIGRCPQIATMLDWAGARIMELIIINNSGSDDYEKAKRDGSSATSMRTRRCWQDISGPSFRCVAQMSRRPSFRPASPISTDWRCSARLPGRSTQVEVRASARRKSFIGRPPPVTM